MVKNQYNRTKFPLGVAELHETSQRCFDLPKVFLFQNQAQQTGLSPDPTPELRFAYLIPKISVVYHKQKLNFAVVWSALSKN